MKNHITKEKKMENTEKTIMNQIANAVKALGASKAYGISLRTQSLIQAAPELKWLQDRLHLNTIQVCLLIGAVELSSDEKDFFLEQEFAAYLNIDPSALPFLKLDLDELERRGLLMHEEGVFFLPDSAKELLETNLFSPPENPDLWREVSLRTTILNKKVLQNISGWSKKICRHIDTWEEAAIYLKAALVEVEVAGRPALIRPSIEWGDYSIKRNKWLAGFLPTYSIDQEYCNADLAGEGYAPRDPEGNPIELHHIGQRKDSPLAELTVREHREGDNYRILHMRGSDETLDRQQFAREKAAHWQARFKALTPEELDKIYGHSCA